MVVTDSSAPISTRQSPRQILTPVSFHSTIVQTFRFTRGPIRLIVGLHTIVVVFVVESIDNLLIVIGF